MTLLLGDCIETMREMQADSVDAIVCDPPYGLEFMGKEWDGPKGFSTGAGTTSTPGIGERDTAWVSNQGWNGFRCTNCGHLAHGGSPCSCDAPNFARADNRWHLFQEWCEAWAIEALRVLKPGGHMLAFGGTRTYHRLACAIEDAGFEIRDSIDWIYGSGFPKSMDVSKAIDKAAGATREVVGTAKGAGSSNTEALGVYRSEYAATPDAATWQGWGTALKPAHEPIVLARKPLIGTVAKNVLAHGTGALNIDASRIATTDKWKATGVVSAPGTALAGSADGSLNVSMSSSHSAGRWPANIILDEEAGAMLDEQTGTLNSGAPRAGVHKIVGGSGIYSDSNEGPMPEVASNSGGASRFFYCAKASKSERNAGLDDKNTHPTVKPLTLMRYLVRLITPPEGICLDPFMGSGTTGLACAAEGFDFIGIERDPEYFALAEQRIKSVEMEEAA